MKDYLDVYKVYNILEILLDPSLNFMTEVTEK